MLTACTGVVMSLHGWWRGYSRYAYSVNTVLSGLTLLDVCQDYQSRSCELEWTRRSWVWGVGLGSGDPLTTTAWALVTGRGNFPMKPIPRILTWTLLCSLHHSSSRNTLHDKTKLYTCTPRPPNACMGTRQLNTRYIFMLIVSQLISCLSDVNSWLIQPWHCTNFYANYIAGTGIVQISDHKFV